ncbi:LacI family DNA-binding transcriptional regulator [Cellulomonas sp. PhB143]|uniref:LacI family DNA-binding transcriptional regulator n=1 Tax=Cellulomonas sp. PhB143 TaxID=2485186 RepID=UPI000FAA0DED|nr:LacI family DNA-binding transcriptional regulator [Cellulomonas sp. PhB143]ROS73336.1 LacI family transcriptional regulator [Cellulomonas sp. PhB143]
MDQLGGSGTAGVQVRPAAGGRRKGPGPSMADVAALAQVSSQTVSRVANGHPSVRADTRDRVLAAMETLGYAPNTAARALRYGRFGTIGLIAHRLARTGESRTVEGVVEAARALGLTVTLVDVLAPTTHDMTEAVAQLNHQSIDGLVIIRSELSATENLLLPARLPVVVSDSRLLGSRPAVGTDQGQGSRLLVEHLLGLGHRTVHHLAGPAESGPAQERRDVWAQVLRAAGRPVPPHGEGDWTAQAGYAWGAGLDLDDVTAVFCANDEMAAGVVRALHERGVRVPQEVSVVGFDDVALAGYLWPPLTTVRQDFQKIGAELVRLLAEQMDSGQDMSDVHVTVPVELVTRESTAPPRTGALR